MINRNSKQLVRDLFDGKELPRTPFLPWVCSFAAKLEQLPIRRALSDATLLSKSLRNCQKLFGYDAIINIFDSTLEAEALGCKIEWAGSEEAPRVISHPLAEGASTLDFDLSQFDKRGRIPVVIETTKRLSIEKGREVAIIGFITGPLTLSRYLTNCWPVSGWKSGTESVTELIELVQKVIVRLCRLYCECSVDAIVIADEMFSQMDVDLYRMVAPGMRTVWNITRFHNAHSIILTNKAESNRFESIFELPASGVVLSGNTDYSAIKTAALRHNRCFSFGISCSSMTDIPGQAKKSLKDCLGTGEKRGVFLSTDWEIPYTTPVATMHKLMGEARSI